MSSNVYEHDIHICFMIQICISQAQFMGWAHWAWASRDPTNVAIATFQMFIIQMVSHAI